MAVHKIFENIFIKFGLIPAKELPVCPRCGSEEYGWRAAIAKAEGAAP